MTARHATLNALFVCDSARARGPTAAQVFADRAHVRTDFAGTGRDATDPVSEDQIGWADVIFAMEQRHQTRLMDLYPDAMAGRRVIVLRIPARYGFMDAALVRLLTERAGPYL